MRLQAWTGELGIGQLAHGLELLDSIQGDLSKAVSGPLAAQQNRPLHPKVAPELGQSSPKFEATGSPGRSLAVRVSVLRCSMHRSGGDPTFDYEIIFV